MLSNGACGVNVNGSCGLNVSGTCGFNANEDEQPPARAVLLTVCIATTTCRESRPGSRNQITRLKWIAQSKIRAYALFTSPVYFMLSASPCLLRSEGREPCPLGTRVCSRAISFGLANTFGQFARLHSSPPRFALLMHLPRPDLKLLTMPGQTLWESSAHTPPIRATSCWATPSTACSSVSAPPTTAASTSTRL